MQGSSSHRSNPRRRVTHLGVFLHFAGGPRVTARAAVRRGPRRPLLPARHVAARPVDAQRVAVQAQRLLLALLRRPRGGMISRQRKLSTGTRDRGSIAAVDDDDNNAQRVMTKLGDLDNVRAGKTHTPEACVDTGYDVGRGERRRAGLTAKARARPYKARHKRDPEYSRHPSW